MDPGAHLCLNNLASRLASQPCIWLTTSILGYMFGICTSLEILLLIMSSIFLLMGGDFLIMIVFSLLLQGAHPFHIHINHFQIVEDGITGTDPNWTILGDWLVCHVLFAFYKNIIIIR